MKTGAQVRLVVQYDEATTAALFDYVVDVNTNRPECDQNVT
jgi:hypothetical protein